MLHRILMFFLALCLGLTMGPSAEASYERYSASFFDSFDTVIQVLGYAENMEIFDKVSMDAEQRFFRLHQLYNKYEEYKGVVNVYTLNHEAAKAPVKVEDELFDLLKYGKDMYAFTNGQVNIAFGAVLALWHDARDAAEADPAAAYIPDMDALKEAAKHCDINDLVLNEEDKTVFFEDPLLQLDVGALAKGYAVELVADEMLSGPMPSFIVNAGGNIRTGQPPKEDHPHWRVAVQDPDGFVLSNASSDIVDVLYLDDMSVVTSGDYQRFFMLDGERYHHIISPETLMPPRHFRSVTIVTKDSGYADLLSTALFIMSYEEGRAFVDALPDVEALWIMNDKSIVMTDGLVPYARSQGADGSK